MRVSILLLDVESKSKQLKFLPTKFFLGLVNLYQIEYVSKRFSFDQYKRYQSRPRLLFLSPRESSRYDYSAICMTIRLLQYKRVPILEISKFRIYFVKVSRQILP